MKELNRCFGRLSGGCDPGYVWDHLPTIGTDCGRSENKYLFQTEYVIWDNMGLTKKDENLASYQIAAEVLDRVGIHEGTIMNIIRQEEIPRIIRSIWRHCSMMCCTVSDMLMEEKILLREQRCGWDFMM